MIPISKPWFNDSILQYAHDAIDSTWVSSTGKYIQKTAEKLQEITGIEYILLTNNGTSAMHLVARCLQKFKGGQNIIVPDNVYVAAWNSFLYDHYYFISPVKSDLETWNVDIESIIKKANNGSIVLFVHNLGNIIPISYIREKLPNTIFVEDNCEGFHSKYSLHKESFCGGVSFYGNKIITSGEGGAFLCHDKEVYDYAKKLLGQGQTSEKFIHDELGYNYRMTNVQAAILYGQLKYLEDIEDMRKGVFDLYGNLIKGLSVKAQKICGQHSRWMFGVKIPGNKSYKKVKEFFDIAGIETRPMFYPMSYHKHLKIYSNELEEANSVALNNEVVLLPTYPELSFEDIYYITETLSKYAEQNNLL